MAGLSWSGRDSPPPLVWRAPSRCVAIRLEIAFGLIDKPFAIVFPNELRSKILTLLYTIQIDCVPHIRRRPDPVDDAPLFSRVDSVNAKL